MCAVSWWKANLLPPGSPLRALCVRVVLFLMPYATRHLPFPPPSHTNTLRELFFLRRRRAVPTPTLTCNHVRPCPPFSRVLPVLVVRGRGGSPAPGTMASLRLSQAAARGSW
jgi:hypothetical protein